MSDSREQSYYEIALTNRQVMSIFIVLLVCLLTAFVSGVWIGRQGAGVRVQTADAQRIEGERSAGEAPLGEMDFFSSGRRQKPSARTASDAAAAPPAAPTAEPPEAASPLPQPAPTGTAAGSGATQPPDEPASPRRSAADSTSAAASGEFLYIQVFSSIDRAQAQTIVDQLRRGGYAAFLSSVEVDDRLMHRVRIGPYAERSEAEGVAERVQREHKLSTWITP